MTLISSEKIINELKFKLKMYLGEDNHEYTEIMELVNTLYKSNK